MNEKTKLSLIVFLMVLSCACGIFGSTEKTSKELPRTYYETLDLSTPESAVKTFAEAFGREDFLSVYLILSARTQFVIHQSINLLHYDHLFQSRYREVIIKDALSEAPGRGEHLDGWYLFDQIMLSAKRHSALLIDLSGEIEIKKTEKSETEYEEDAIDVIAIVEGVDGEVIFRMVQAPSGRWRVDKVIVGGGSDDDTAVPWSVPDLDE